MDNKSARQNSILQIIEAQGMQSVKSLATTLNVSEMTIRRDLNQLHHQDKLQGAKNEERYNLLSAAQKSFNQKDRIGKFAASLIEPNDVLIIDTGSTTARLLPYFPDKQNLTVVCYNANVMLELRNKAGIELFMCGGIYHKNTEMFESPESIHFIERIRANKVFLSAAGVDDVLGITCENAHEVPTKNAVIQASATRILMADSSKFGQVRSSYFCKLEDLDIIITDSDISDEWKEKIHAKGLTLYTI